MNALIDSSTLQLSGEALLERSRWYGPNLFTFLATASETNGSFSLIKCWMRKGFEPPLHVHTREDESSFILDGEVAYEIDGKQIHARPGNYVRLPRLLPHGFKILSETATVLLLITPGGFEEMFIKFSRPATSFALPPVSGERPGKEFFEQLDAFSQSLGVTTLPVL